MFHFEVSSKFLTQNQCFHLSDIYLFKVNTVNTRTTRKSVKVNNKDTYTTSIDFITLVSLLLTLNTFYTLFWCFHCWTSKCQLGNWLWTSSIVTRSWETMISSTFTCVNTPTFYSVPSQTEKTKRVFTWDPKWNLPEMKFQPTIK